MTDFGWLPRLGIVMPSEKTYAVDSAEASVLALLFFSAVIFYVAHRIYENFKR